MGTYTPQHFFYKPRLGARGYPQKNLFDLSLDKVDARLAQETWVGDPRFVWRADPAQRLQNAVSGLNTTPALLRLPPETYVICQAYTVPANITVVLERGAVFLLENDATLTLDGGAAAGPYQIFTGAGAALFIAGLCQFFIRGALSIAADGIAYQKSFRNGGVSPPGPPRRAISPRRWAPAM